MATATSRRRARDAFRCNPMPPPTHTTHTPRTRPWQQQAGRAERCTRERRARAAVPPTRLSRGAHNQQPHSPCHCTQRGRWCCNTGGLGSNDEHHHTVTPNLPPPFSFGPTNHAHCHMYTQARFADFPRPSTSPFENRPLLLRGWKSTKRCTGAPFSVIG